MSDQIGSNQLKLNLNAVVDNLNLVNVIHKPSPIVIEKIPSNGSNQRLPSSNLFRSNSQFECIDENKLSMYSYLVQRELKTKEWLSKYESNNFEQPVTKPKEITNPDSKPKRKEKRPNSESVATIVKPTPKKSPPNNPKSFNSDDLNLCCQDLTKNLEDFHNILNEFKEERLKIVFNDPLEEEKQNRIHIEQIKYLSRSIYNYQNQISTLRSQIKKDKDLSSIYQRMIHTMRQIIKLIVSFGEIYPYRQEKNAISEKLCGQFYKNLNKSIKNFADCLSCYEQNHINKLNNLIHSCDQFFVINEEKNQSEPVDSNTDKDTKQSRSKNINQIYNVVRVSRSSQAKNNNDVAKVSSKRIFDKKKPKNQFSNVRFEISPPRSRPKQVFQNKKIKTAKLFPSNRISSKSKSQSDLDLVPTKEAKEKPNVEQKSLEDLNSSLNELDILSKSNDQVFKPAFRHLSSPKLGKIKPTSSRSRSRSLSAEKPNNKLHRTISNETDLDSKDYEPNSNYFYEKPSSEFIRPILKTSRGFNSAKLFEKMESIRQENDLIRRKYQNLSYINQGIELITDYENSKPRRPYQECYLDQSAKARVQDLECPVTFKKVYKPLNGPSLDQLKRVVKYSEDFGDYNRKTSITKIGDSEFDDFELFELLSNDLFEEFFESIYEEIENVNEQVAQNLLNNEFESEAQEEMSKKSHHTLNEYDQSFEQTVNSSKQLDTINSPQRKSTKTVSIRKTSSKTSSSSNNQLSQQNDLVMDILEEQIYDNIAEEIPDQINTHLSSIHSNIDESISSISD